MLSFSWESNWSEIRSMMVFFLVMIFPLWILFHLFRFLRMLLSFWTKLATEFARDGVLCHHVCMRSSKLLVVYQKSSNLNTFLDGAGMVCRRGSGQWSKEIFVKGISMVRGKRLNQSSDTRHLSSFASIGCSWWFDHVWSLCLSLI